jgi:hypothetical protein
MFDGISLLFGKFRPLLLLIPVTLVHDLFFQVGSGFQAFLAFPSPGHVTQ